MPSPIHYIELFIFKLLDIFMSTLRETVVFQSAITINSYVLRDVRIMLFFYSCRLCLALTVITKPNSYILNKIALAVKTEFASIEFQEKKQFGRINNRLH